MNPVEKKILCTLKQKCKTILDPFDTRERGNNTLTEFPPGEELEVPMGYPSLSLRVSSLELTSQWYHFSVEPRFRVRSKGKGA